MKKFLLTALCIWAGALNAQNESQISYTLENKTDQPITCTLSFKAYGPRGRRIRMNYWKQEIAAHSSLKKSHPFLEDMNITIQDRNSHTIMDNILPTQGGMITILPQISK